MRGGRDGKACGCACLDEHAAERKSLRHGRACAVLTEVGHIRVHGGEKRADALVEQISGEDQVEVAVPQTALAQREVDGGALKLAFRKLPRLLSHAVVPRDEVKTAAERAFALFFADRGGVRQQIRAVFERKRAFSGVCDHPAPPPFSTSSTRP